MHRVVQQDNCSIPYKFEDTNIGNKKPKMKGQTTQWFTKGRQHSDLQRADNTVIYKQGKWAVIYMC
jgi:hypothetical protein